jgi:hypothetical protein
VAIPQQPQLAAETFPGGIVAGIMVTEHAGHRQRQLGQGAGNAHVAVAEVAHHEQAIGSQPPQQLLIAPIPLIVKIPGDGQLNHTRRGAGILSL